MANNNVKFPCTNAGVAHPSISEDSDEEFYKTRIMLIANNKEIKLPAIKNLCSRFGELNRPIHVPANQNNWFFVEFKTTSEAEQAIRYINENKHLQIRAMFSKKKKGGDNASRQSNRNNDHQPIDTNADIPIQMQNRKIQGPFAKNIGMNRIPNEGDSFVNMQAQMNILTNGGAYSRPNDDRFKVVNGRSTFQESATNVALMQAMAGKSQGAYDTATNSFGYGVGEPTKVIVGPCTKCGRVSETQCEVCLDPYCSPSCQRLDWPTHKKVCRPMPALVPAICDPETSNISKPVEKVVPFLPLPTLKSQLFSVAPARKPAQVSQRMPSSPPAVATPAVSLQKEIDLITQRIKSTMVKDQPLHAPFPLSGAKVVITAAPSPGVLYLRPIDKASDLNFRQVLEDVTRYAATAEFLKVKPKRGNFVLAAFEGVYYRANVLSPTSGCTDDTIKVAYIDFGNMAVVRWRECKVIDSPDLIGRTRHNFKVYLLNVDYTKHTNDATVQLINQCVDESAEFEVRYDGELPIKEKREVTLIRVSDNMSLNARIKELATIVPPKLDEVAVFGHSDLKVKEIPTGKNMHLIVLDVSCLAMGEVTCILKNDLPNWQAVLHKVTTYCATMSAKEFYKPRENELCLAQFEDEAQEKSWYRGICAESVGDQHPTICFIDFGNITPVAVADIRKIPKELVQLPLHATTCRIRGLPDDINEILPQLEAAFVAGQEIFVDAVDKEEEMEQNAKHTKITITINSLNL